MQMSNIYINMGTQSLFRPLTEEILHDPAVPLRGDERRGAMIRGPIRQAPLVTQVSKEFRRLMASGQWAVGEKIPGEHELTERLGVSRATVREALRGLTNIGLLEPRVGDGTYVRATDEITGVLVRDQLSTALMDVLDARAGLEAATARLAAQQGTPNTVAAISDALDVRARTHEAGDAAEYARADATFHRAVVLASGNPLLIRLHTAVAEILDASILDTTVLPEDPGVGQAHRRLFEAIQEGQPDAAAAIAYELIESVKNTVSEPPNANDRR